MPSVLAFDYDGTIARGGRLREPMRAALAVASKAGFALVLATGRILEHLLRECPDALALFDRVVAENGAVLAQQGLEPRLLADPVDRRLAVALEREGIEVVRGQVLLAFESRHEREAQAAAAALGLDVRWVRNRASGMVLPAAITKAAGLSHALASLGVSEKQTVAFGDAENDVEMLGACALGVAVADAVLELKDVADVVLTESGPEGVATFVRGLAASAESSNR